MKSEVDDILEIFHPSFFHFVSPSSLALLDQQQAAMNMWMWMTTSTPLIACMRRHSVSHPFFTYFSHLTFITFRKDPLEQKNVPHCWHWTQDVPGYGHKSFIFWSRDFLKQTEDVVLGIHLKTMFCKSCCSLLKIVILYRLLWSANFF